MEPGFILVVGQPTDEQRAKLVDVSAHVFVKEDKADVWKDRTVHVFHPPCADAVKTVLKTLVSEHEQSADRTVLCLVVDGLASEWQSEQWESIVLNCEAFRLRVIYVVEDLCHVLPVLRTNATEVFLTDTNPQACEKLGLPHCGLSGPLRVSWDQTLLRVEQW